MNHLSINLRNRKNTISRNLYGQFSEHLGRGIYGGIYVGEDSDISHINGMRQDVVEALKKIKVPVLRWPGGCFADEYHWKDGIGPRESRKKMVNTHWGGLVEDNSFGTHEFMELCRQLGCEPYVNGNLGSGTVQEMSEWMEYMTFDGISPMAELRAQNGHPQPWRVHYFGVGNENWGCGGSMRPEYYADEYRRYQTYVRNYGDNRVFRLVCGPNADDYNWTQKLMEIAGPYMDGLTLHYYTQPGKNRSATDFDENDYYVVLKNALRMEELVSSHLQIMHRYDPTHNVALLVDEWGTWYDVEPGTNPGFLYQQNTMRDAIAAAATLNIFNQYSSRVKMANIAQMVNVLQSMILTEGAKMVLTPTYHVFDLFSVHQEATLVGSWLEAGETGPAGCRVPLLSQSASVDGDGVLHITLVNLSASSSCTIRTTLEGMEEIGTVSAQVLSGAIQGKNDFEAPQRIQPAPLKNVDIGRDCFDLELPACSVAAIAVR
ncbi:MAG: alpha-N-arabinofuranosidase [Clostridiales bacterium]|nr:alpha-N-arabinofuranosidase [Clostridiales bacterium]